VSDLYKNAWVTTLKRFVGDEIKHLRSILPSDLPFSQQPAYETRLKHFEAVQQRLHLLDAVDDMWELLQAINQIGVNPTKKPPLGEVASLVAHIQKQIPTRSYDVFMESFVNVALPATVDTDSDEGYMLLREAAVEKYLEAIHGSYCEFTWKEYKDGEYVEPEQEKSA
jgi:hypothetical protein